MFPVIEDIADASDHTFSLLTVREADTYAGYVKLQLVMEGVPCVSIYTLAYPTQQSSKRYV